MSAAARFRRTRRCSRPRGAPGPRSRRRNRVPRPSPWRRSQRARNALSSGEGGFGAASTVGFATGFSIGFSTSGPAASAPPAGCSRPEGPGGVLEEWRQRRFRRPPPRPPPGHRGRREPTSSWPGPARSRPAPRGGAGPPARRSPEGARLLDAGRRHDGVAVSTGFEPPDSAKTRTPTRARRSPPPTKSSIGDAERRRRFGAGQLGSEPSCPATAPPWRP
jgi:hypothetical protein